MAFEFATSSFPNTVTRDTGYQRLALGGGLHLHRHAGWHLYLWQYSRHPEDGAGGHQCASGRASASHDHHHPAAQCWAFGLGCFSRSERGHRWGWVQLMLLMFSVRQPAGVSTSQHATFHSLNSYFSCMCCVCGVLCVCVVFSLCVYFLCVCVLSVCVWVCTFCVCVCMCVWEREREGEW